MQRINLFFNLKSAYLLVLLINIIVNHAVAKDVRRSPIIIDPVFKTLGSYLEYKRVGFVKGKDAANIYLREYEQQDNNRVYTDYLPLTGGNLTGALYGTTIDMLGRIKTNDSYQVTSGGYIILNDATNSGFIQFNNAGGSFAFNAPISGTIATFSGSVTANGINVPSGYLLNLNGASNGVNSYYPLNRNAITTEQGFFFYTNGSSKWFLGQRSYNAEDGFSIWSGALSANALYISPSGTTTLNSFGQTSPAQLMSSNGDNSSLLLSAGVTNGYVSSIQIIGNYNGSGAAGGDIVMKTASTERLRLLSTGEATFSGNVGIGTTAPTEKLSVNGNIRSKKLIVTQTGWADYVFKPAYKLRSLTEVEQYIKIHQHLPDIPSDKEVKSKGIDVGETQVMLLRKIEELTLYVIKQERRIVELEKQVSKNKHSKTGK